MKIIVTKTNIKNILGALDRTHTKTSHLPILKNFLFDVSDHEINLTVTDLEIAATFRVNGKIIEKGRLTAPIKIFSNLIQNINSERIHIEKKNTTLYVKTENYEANIQGLPAEEYPLIPKIKNKTHQIVVSQDTFREALEQTIIATQSTELHPELNSVLFDFSPDAIRCTGTDSFRLAEKTIQKNQFTSSFEENFQILIPIKTIRELLFVLGEKEKIEIFKDEHQVFFKTESIEIISRLIEGTFPEYKKITPKEFSSELLLDKEELTRAVKLTGVLSGQTNEIKMKVLGGKKAVEISSLQHTVGENKYLLPAKIKGQEKEIGFNWRYLLDGLRALKTESVFFGINEEHKPALIKSPGDASYYYILMPILKI